MSHRAAMLSPSFVEALNAVPVDFYGKGNNLKEINDAWKLYLDHLDQNVQPSDAWSQKKIDLFNDLLFRISQFLGYRFSKAQLARDIYSPRAHGELEAQQETIRRGLAGLFTGDTSLPLVVKEFPDIGSAAPGQ